MISDTQLKRIMPFATAKNLALFIVPLNDAMAEFNIDNPTRQAMFLAQVAHESGSLSYTSELASGIAYDHREDLGNTKPDAIMIAASHNTTPGPFYKGHGLIQITGYLNHKACGEALKIDCLHNPELLCLPVNAARSAGWFWETHGCNDLADAQLYGKITRIINGGENGIADRVANLARAKNVLAA